MTEQERKDELRRLRTRTGLSRKDFAKLYHIGLSTESEWERELGTGPPESVLYLLKRTVEKDFPSENSDS